ncbi:hypothetical protein B0H17DRAFT_1042126 [Mycena rosella]|uniref:Uncharacterized protein n=1 Tax=Mycena rosella TaxID=1033263 RepID=A0AAD7E267_MYCRO|nr:hypothetical protein B0H17DRAFT_1042126 [Mycena rosella]
MPSLPDEKPPTACCCCCNFLDLPGQKAVEFPTGAIHSTKTAHGRWGVGMAEDTGSGGRFSVGRFPPGIVSRWAPSPGRPSARRTLRLLVSVLKRLTRPIVIVHLTERLISLVGNDTRRKDNPPPRHPPCYLL